MKKWVGWVACWMVVPLLAACTPTPLTESLAKRIAVKTSAPEGEAVAVEPETPPAPQADPLPEVKEPPQVEPKPPADEGRPQPGGGTPPEVGSQTPPEATPAPEPQPVTTPPPASTQPVPPPQPQPPADLQTVYRHGAATVKQVALTFDDGPDAVYTVKILDVLKSQNVKATFFLIGLNAERHPDVVQRIAAEGHAVGNHTWNHVNLPKITPAQVETEIDRTSDALAELIGYRPTLVRPPFGALSPVVTQDVNEMGYRIVNWSVDPRDWAGTPADQIVSHVKTHAGPGSIILLHSAGGKGGKLDNTVAALPQVIADFKAQGYQFVTVPEILDLPKSL